MTHVVETAERLRTSTRRVRSDNKDAPCPTCAGRTAAFRTVPPRVWRVCAKRHVFIWFRSELGLSDPRRPLTPKDRIKFPDRWPLCAFGDCDRLRETYLNAVNRTKGGGVLCYGHAKQHDRGQPLRPLLSADPSERGREAHARRMRDRMTYLWRMGSLAGERPCEIYEGERLVRVCPTQVEAETVVLAHNRYVAEPAPRAPDLDDDVSEPEAGLLRDEELRREES